MFQIFHKNYFVFAHVKIIAIYPPRQIKPHFYDQPVVLFRTLFFGGRGTENFETLFFLFVERNKKKRALALFFLFLETNKKKTRF